MDKVDPVQRIIEVKNKDLIHQVLNVLRLTPTTEAEISFIDGSGIVLEAEILVANKNCLQFAIRDQYQSRRELQTQVKFLVPIIKPEAFSIMLRKLTELGVQEFQPVIYARSQEPYLRSFLKQKSKLITLIQEATEQCEGAVFAHLNDPIKLDDLVVDQATVKIFAYENLSGDMSVSEFFAKLQLGPKIILAVGPEGGLLPEEAKYLQAQGFKACSLGKRLLKAETAAVSLFSSLMLD